MVLEWRNSDPRYHFSKRGSIIIVRPDGKIGQAHVDVKEGWWIFTTFEDHRSIDAWDKDWVWIHAPEEKV